MIDYRKLRPLYTFVVAMYRWVRGGMNLLHPAIIQIRWEVCNNCEYKRKGWFRYFCALCKCTLSFRRHPFNKLAHPCERCPLGLWTQMYGTGCPPRENTHEVKRVPGSCTSYGCVQHATDVSESGSGG